MSDLGKKISALPETADLNGLYTIGTDKNTTSKKVSLQFLKEAATYANAQGDYAKSIGDTVAGNVGSTDYPVFSASGIYAIGDVVRYNDRLYRFTAPHQAGSWTGADVELTSINEESQRKLTELESTLPRNFKKSGVVPYQHITPFLPNGFFIPKGSIIKNLGIKVAIAFDASLNGRLDLLKGDEIQVQNNYYHIQALEDGGEAHIVFNVIGEELLLLSQSGLGLVETSDRRIKAFFKDIKLYNLPSVENPSISLFSVARNKSGNWYLKLIHTQEEYYGIYGYVIDYNSSIEESHIDYISPQGVRIVADVDWSVLANSEVVGFNRGEVVFNPVSYHYHPVLDNNSIKTDYLQYKSVTTDKVDFIGSVNLVDIDADDVAVGYYVYQGALSANSTLNTTGYIRIKSNTQYSVVAAGATLKARFISFYDENKKWLSDASPLVENVTSPSQAMYMRVTYFVEEWDIAQVTEGVAKTYSPYQVVVSPDLIPAPDVAPTPILSAFHKKGIIAQGQSITLPLNGCHRNTIISAVIEGSISVVKVGVGENYWQGGYIELTNQDIKLYVEGTLIKTLSHGLSLIGRTYVTIQAKGKLNAANNPSADIIISSGGSEFKTEQYWYSCGEPFITNSGSGELEVELSFFPRNLNSEVWAFGDSYFGYANPGRWLHYAVKEGYNSFLENFFSGGTSENAKQSLSSLLTIGTPKVIIWCLGMNDGTDSNSAPSNLWQSAINWLVATCRERKVSLILATIPSVPSVNNEKKNEWVRNSGFRYIDFAKAVNAQPNGTWDADFLSSDKVHPSPSGALVLYHQALVDCPEITKL